MISFLRKIFQFGPGKTGNAQAGREMTPSELGYDFLTLGTEGSSPTKVGENNIKYNPNLVVTLKKQHKKLVVLFLDVEKLVKEGLDLINQNGDPNIKFDLAHQVLNQFLQLLKNHVIVENLLLYSYLRKNDPKKDVVSLQGQMRAIQRAVIDFTDVYVKLGFTPRNAQDFLDTWVGVDGFGDVAKISRANSMKSILTSRISTEEEDGLYMAYDSIGTSETEISNIAV